MAHRMSENSGTSRKADRIPTLAAPTKMPMSAVPIGSPIATTEPKASSSTMMATPTPISSLLGVSWASEGEVTGQLHLHPSSHRAASRDGQRVVAAARR